MISMMCISVDSLFHKWNSKQNHSQNGVVTCILTVKSLLLLAGNIESNFKNAITAEEILHNLLQYTWAALMNIQ